MQKSMVSLMLLVLLSVVVSASAQSVSEKGLSLVASSGSELTPWHISVLFTESCSGRVLEPRDGSLGPRRDSDIFGQIAAWRDDRGQRVTEQDFKFAVATRNDASVGKGQWIDAKLNDGVWEFTIPCKEYRAVGGTPLIIYAQVNGGKKDYVRFVFKWTYDKDPTASANLLWVRPLDQKPTPAVQPKMETRESVDPQKLQQQLDKVNASFETNLIDHKEYARLLQQILQRLCMLEERDACKGEWIRQAIAVSEANAASVPPPPNTAVITTTISVRQTLEERYAGDDVVVFGRTKGSGTYRYFFRLKQDSRWVRFNKPCTVSYDDEVYLEELSKQDAYKKYYEVGMGPEGSNAPTHWCSFSARECRVLMLDEKGSE